MDDETQQFMRHWWSNKEKTGARTVDGRENNEEQAPVDADTPGRCRSSMKRIGRILACLIIAGVATGCKGASRPSPQTSPRPVKWLVYGDSLTAQAGEYLKSHGSVGVRFYPDMAPCSWIPNLASDPTDFTPQTVLLQFIGNQPVCINGRDPQQAYQRDLTTIAQFWKRRGVRVVMVLSPKTPPDNVAWARQAELRVANILGLPVNNAGADVELPGEVFTFFLPCLPDETPSQGCGSEVPAQIRVREKDGIHFGTSPGYSSGARRFADAEARS